MTANTIFEKLKKERKTKIIKVALVGSGGAGKTALRIRMCQDSFISNLNMTIGLEHESKIVNNHILTFYDYGGQPAFEEVRNIFFDDPKFKADIVLLVQDSSNKSDFINLESWYNIAKELAEFKKIILVFSKKDLIWDLEEMGREDEVIKNPEMKTYAESKNLPYIKTSAKTGCGLPELAKLIIEMAP